MASTEKPTTSSTLEQMRSPGMSSSALPHLTSGSVKGDRTLELGDAINAERNEKDMSLWIALKTYRKAVGWSFAISFTLIMEGESL